MSNTMTYQGYTTRLTFDADDKVNVGRVLDVDDIDFHRRPASDKMMLRIAPTVHAGALKAAARNGVSLNKWAKQALCDAAR